MAIRVTRQKPGAPAESRHLFRHGPPLSGGGSGPPLDGPGHAGFRDVPAPHAPGCRFTSPSWAGPPPSRSAALQQMVPVVFSSELAHPELARWAGWVYGPGVAALVSGLATLRPEFLVPGAVLVPAAIFTVLFNVWQTQTASEGKAARRIRPFVMSPRFLTWPSPFWPASRFGVQPGHRLAWAPVGPGLPGPRHPGPGRVVLGCWSSASRYHLLPFFGLTPKKADPRWDRLVLVLLHAGIIATWLVHPHARLELPGEDRAGCPRRGARPLPVGDQGPLRLPAPGEDASHGHVRAALPPLPRRCSPGRCSMPPGGSLRPRWPGRGC